MSKFKEISHFSTALDGDPLGEDVLTGRTQLYFDGSPVTGSIPVGKTLKQFEYDDLYLVITSYSAIDYENFGIHILNHKLKLLDSYVTPNLFECEGFSHVGQFEIEATDTLRFYFAKKEIWAAKVLLHPRLLAGETLSRIARGWWLHFEIGRLFRAGYISINRRAMG